MPESAWTIPDTAVADFARRGLLLLHPKGLGVDTDVHARVYVREQALHDARQPVTPKRTRAAAGPAAIVSQALGSKRRP